MKKNAFLFFLVLTLIALAPSAAQAKDKIVFGQAVGLSGPTASAVGFLEVPISKLWFQEVNKKGGIYVPEYGKKLPVELIRYDDKGDIPTTLKLFEKLATVDKVDVILPPHGTGWHLAVAPLASKFKYPLVGFTNCSEKIREMQHKLKYMFETINNPNDTMVALADLMKELGVKKAAIIYVSHEFGIEFTQSLVPPMKSAGIDIVMRKNYPFGPKDLSPLLKEAKAANVDAFIAHSYVPGTFMMPGQAKTIGFNPKLLYFGLACAWPAFIGKYGAETVEGIMGPGGWNQNMPIEGAKEFYDKFMKMHGRPPDFWASAAGYATFQIWEHTIANVGLKDRVKQRDFIANTPHKTVFGTVDYRGKQINTSPPSLVGQWQSGVFQSIAPKLPHTAKPIYPKAPWPKK